MNRTRAVSLTACPAPLSGARRVWRGSRRPAGAARLSPRSAPSTPRTGGPHELQPHHPRRHRHRPRPRLLRPPMEALGREERWANRAPPGPWAGFARPGTARPQFVVTVPFDRAAPADPGNGPMVAFEVETRAGVDQAHALALALGGTAAGAPGLRPHDHPDYYGAGPARPRRQQALRGPPRAQRPGRDRLRPRPVSPAQALAQRRNHPI